MIQVKLTKKQKALWTIAGYIAFFALFFKAYSYFFERENYLTRKNLYHYLLNNGIDAPESISLAYSWKVKGLELILWKKNRTVSLHSDTGCILSDFHAGAFNNYYYKKIQQILKVKIKDLCDETA